MRSLYILFGNQVRCVLFCLLAIAACHPALAQLSIEQNTIFVTRGGVHVVLDDLDFSNGGSFDGTASAFHLTGIKNTTITVGTSNGFTNLEINKAAGKQVTMLGPMLVTTTLNFLSGNLELNGNQLDLSTGGLLVGESEASHITGLSGGEVRTSAVLTAPVAVNMGNLGAVITSTQNLGNVLISRGHTASAIGANGQSINRYFTITPANNSSLNATLKLLYFNSELNGLNENTLSQFRSTGAAGFTDQNFSARDAASNFVAQTGYATLNGTFTLATGSSNAPLPVTLLNFTARCIGNAVRLGWETALEQNSDRFEVERSSNGLLWDKIGTVPSAGNSTSTRSYQYDDATLATSFAFYRLARYDRDGKVAYSSIVKGGCGAAAGFKVMPNPVSDLASVVIDATNSGRATFIVFDAAGREVIKRAVTLSRGANGFDVNMANLASGTYHAVLVQDGFAGRSIEILKK